MTGRTRPRVFSIPPGVPFLQTLAQALVSGELVPGFRSDGDPLKLADATIYVPTRRAARELRSLFAEMTAGRASILPVIRPLGEFDEEEALFEVGATGAEAIDLMPPIAAIDRLLLLAPLVRAWKRRLPAHVAALFDEEVVVPTSAADSIWLARDLAALMDEVEIEESDWSKLSELVPVELAGWWQVTLDFLEIVTRSWPAVLAERNRSNPAAWRSAVIRLEAARLRRNPPRGPVIAAGSTGSIPATAELLSIIAGLPQGAVVLPGLDKHLDEPSWGVIADLLPPPAITGHPQYGLAKLIGRLGLMRSDVEEIGTQSPALAARGLLVAEALRPADTTDEWAERRAIIREADVEAALAGITLIEAANERQEAAAIAIALRQAISEPGKMAALVTSDRDLARRVSAELLRFSIRADDSGGTPLSRTPPAELFRLMLQAAFRPGDPLAILALLKHPLLTCGQERALVRRAAETIELVALRGGTGRPDIASLADLFEHRFSALADGRRPPFWLPRLGAARIEGARTVLAAMQEGLAPLPALRDRGLAVFSEIIQASVRAFEALGRGADGSLGRLYAGDAGAKLASVLRELVATGSDFSFAAEEWPEMMEALFAPEVVRPAPGAERRIHIWGALEARLQSVDTLVLGGLNEGTWPRRPQNDRFMSRIMKTGIGLEPPERRIGLAAHDFQTALGTEKLVIARAVRSGDAPAVASRWLQRLLTFAGPTHAAAMKARGDQLLAWAEVLDTAEPVPFASRPHPKPPVEVRPVHFSVTEIETLRRDPYAIYARRILELFPLDSLVREPGAAERGTLFHAILHRFSASGIDPRDPRALQVLIEAGRTCFAEADLPEDVSAVWWPRFLRMTEHIIDWENKRADSVKSRHPEERAEPTVVGASGVTLSGYADRIDVLPAGMADILDYKTGSSPSKAQAHTLLSPQLALEGALLKRGAFRGVGQRTPSELAFVRLKPNGTVNEESILEHKRQPRTADELSEEAWSRLEKLLLHYKKRETGYLSRALPFREGETDGDYDHLARVLEWAAGGDGEDGDAE